MIQTYKLEKNKKDEWNYVKVDGGFLCKAQDVNKLIVQMNDKDAEIKKLKSEFKTTDEALQRASIKVGILERLLEKNKIEIPQGRQLPVEGEENVKKKREEEDGKEKTD